MTQTLKERQGNQLPGLRTQQHKGLVQVSPITSQVEKLVNGGRVIRSLVRLLFVKDVMLKACLTAERVQSA